MTDEMRDERLRQALRHAPDAQLGPAASLSEAILAEARAKARRGRATPRPSAASWWHRLTQPAVASALAGVMVATVVGLMWWDQPMDEAMPRRAEPAVVSAPPAVAPAAPAAPPRAEPPPPAQRPAAEPARSVTQKAKAKPALERRAASAEAEKAFMAEAAPPPAAAAAPVATPAPAPVAAADVGDTAARQADSAVLAKKQQERVAQRRESGFIARSEGFLAAGEARRDALRPTPAGFTRLSAAIAAEPARWSWQRDGETAVRPMNDAMLAWLSQLDAATASAWHAGATDTVPTGRRVSLLRDGRLWHTLQIGERSITWQGSAENGAQQADVPGAALQSSLEAVAH